MKKLLLLSFLFFWLLNVKAQNWGGGIDDQDYNWGFNFQYISSEYKIIKKADWRNPYFEASQNRLVTDSLASISSPLSVGFGIGFVINTRLNKNLDVRFTPTLAFTDRMIDYQYMESSGTSNNVFPEGFKQQKVTATMMEFPVGLKIKSDRRQNFRAYLLLGGKYGIDIGSSKSNSDADKIAIEKLLKNKKGIFSYEGGIGFDLYFEYFKMSPEIKLTQSFKDVLKREDHPYSTPIDRAMLRSFTFSLFFE